MSVNARYLELMSILLNALAVKIDEQNYEGRGIFFLKKKDKRH